MKKRLAVALALIAAVLVGAGGLFYQFALPGLSSARPEPPVAEVALATWLLRHSVPGDQAKRTDPLAPTNPISRRVRRCFRASARAAMASTVRDIR